MWAVQGLRLSAAALAKPSSSLQGCLPPLPEEALDRLREYWNGMALSCGAASLRNRENWGSIPAPGERQPGSLDIANASIASVATCLRFLSAARHADAARATGSHKHPCLTFLVATTAGPRRAVFLGAASAAAARSSRRRSRVY